MPNDRLDERPDGQAVAADDAVLVRQAQRGDFAAFSALVERYTRRVYTLALRIVRRPEDAQEVVQETFLSAIEHITDFRGEARFDTWLMRVAANHALKLLRKRRRITLHSFQAPDPADGYDRLPHPEFIASWTDTPERIALRRETQELLDRAVEELDEKYRVVFLLRDVEGLSIRETAAALGLSESNVKVRLLRARLMLRERLTREFGDESARLYPTHEHDG
jgi:RNA polymerase sigma-70 factor (ECF subfamily)